VAEVQHDPESVDVTTPFLDISEVATAWGFNAREATAYALGWRQAVTYGPLGATETPLPALRIRCHRDQAGALLAGLVDAGAQVQGYGSYRDHKTYVVGLRP